MIDPILFLPLFGSIIVSIVSAIVGTFAYLRKESLLGDATAHSMLPGVCLAYILFSSKHTAVLLAGAFVFAFLSQWILSIVSSFTKLKKETVLGVVLSVFFGLGIFLLTIIQHSGVGSQSGLDKFLFGKATTISSDDVYVFLGIAIVAIISIVVFYKELLATSFDSTYSLAIFGSTKFIDVLYSVLVVSVIVLGIQMAGIILISALLITPTVIARNWANSVKLMMLIGVISSVFCTVLGVVISALVPKIPTGPMIVFCLSCLFIISAVISPKSSFWRKIKQSSIQWKVFDENVLKYLFKLELGTTKAHKREIVVELSKTFNKSVVSTQKSIQRLITKGYIEGNNQTVLLTSEGVKKAQRLIKLHRLWEVYLVEYVHIAPDHVHEDAESLEHIITPEIERKLEELLQFPEHCPHQKRIPYSIG
ncbi:MAG: metal ABC transporter permease [Candidatus Kapabacteria bacterium]|nr:metal ABC transporter permease [Candidatus Kapabacteria bacterium]